MTPSIEERLCAAAFTILTDEFRHSVHAMRWAVMQLRRSHGRLTAFQRQLRINGRVL